MLRNQICRDDDGTDKNDDGSTQSGAVAVPAFCPDNQHGHDSRNYESDNDTPIKAELVPDKEGMEEAIREEVTQLVRDEVRQELM
jgi:hypothetical protein